MDNFEQEENQIESEKELIEEPKEQVEGEDIEFDETVDIEEIQKALKQHMEGRQESIEQIESTELASAASNLPEIDPKSKKYVIYVNSENIDFMESLSVNDRKLIINKILREQDEFVAKQKRDEERKTFFKHALVSCATVVIGFPILFFTVNKAMELTILNYQAAQKNFSQLYKQQGKIKPADTSVLDKYKY